MKHPVWREIGPLLNVSVLLFLEEVVCVVNFVPGGVVSSVVQHVLVPVINRHVCNELYDKISDKVKLEITDDMMCAGLEEGGKDACQVGPVLYPSLHIGCDC